MTVPDTDDGVRHRRHGSASIAASAPGVRSAISITGKPAVDEHLCQRDGARVVVNLDERQDALRAQESPRATADPSPSVTR